MITGRVIKPYGLLGWVKAESLSTNPQRFRAGSTFILEGKADEGRLCLEAVRETPSDLLLKFEGMESREQVEGLRGKLLLVTAGELGEPPPESMWEHQVIGLEVMVKGEDRLGEVVEILETGANDVIVVRGDREYLIPMIEEVVIEVDLEAGLMFIDPIPGLLE